MLASGRNGGDIRELTASAFGFLKRFERDSLGSQHASLVCHELQVLLVRPKKLPGYIMKQTGLLKM